MTLPFQESTYSAIITSYNYGHLAAHAIESALNQTKKFDEILLIDDGVGDCQHLRKLYSEIRILQRRSNLGIVRNFNKALNQVTTNKVLFLGADNWLHPRTLEMLSGDKSDIVTYDCYMVGHWDMTKTAQYEQDGYVAWKTNGTPHGSSLYNVELARQVGGYEASGNKHTEEDSVLFNKMIKAGASVGYIERPLLYYRMHKGNFNVR